MRRVERSGAIVEVGWRGCQPDRYVSLGESVKYLRQRRLASRVTAGASRAHGRPERLLEAAEAQQDAPEGPPRPTEGPGQHEG
jgi:hypothetical protein